MENKQLNRKPSQEELDKEIIKLRRRLNFDESSLADRTLVALRNGDHQAYHDIYYTYKESIEYFLRRLLRSDEDAKDLTQTIFVNVWEKRATLDPTKSIKSFLYSVAKNTAANYFKHLRVIDRYINHEIYSDGMDYDSADAMVAQETQILIEIAVNRMPAKRKMVFEMSRYEQMSNEEIARKLNMNKLTVASHIAQAVKEIREVLTLFYIFFIMNQ